MINPLSLHYGETYIFYEESNKYSLYRLFYNNSNRYIKNDYFQKYKRMRDEENMILLLAQRNVQNSMAGNLPPEMYRYMAEFLFEEKEEVRPVVSDALDYVINMWWI